MTEYAQIFHGLFSGFDEIAEIPVQVRSGCLLVTAAPFPEKFPDIRHVGPAGDVFQGFVVNRYNR